jgi:hypothetical protein
MLKRGLNSFDIPELLGLIVSVLTVFFLYQSQFLRQPQPHQ